MTDPDNPYTTGRLPEAFAAAELDPGLRELADADTAGLYQRHTPEEVDAAMDDIHSQHRLETDR